VAGVACERETPAMRYVGWGWEFESSI
jgi:hypothetical protein